MRLLLDTHVWFWALQSPEKLGPGCRSILEEPGNEVAVATISTLELAQLISAGRIELKGTLEAWVRRGIEIMGMQSFELTHPISVLAYALPGTFHTDPADRILVATAIHHGLSLITADERILAYPHAVTVDARN